MTPQPHRMDERNHVEKPLLDQLAGLGWEILDLDNRQLPTDSHRGSFNEVVMLPVLRERLQVINSWLEKEQIDEVVKRLTATFPGTGLLENNRHVFNLLLENTSLGQNRQTGERSPTVHFVDFKNREQNSFIAVCQFKVRVLGTEHHIIPDIVLFLNGLPVVVIECKSPRVKDAIPEAIDQLLRYSEQRGASGEGSAPLFYYNQFVVATCRQQAKFGTITTHSEKYFYRWADPFPRTVDDLEHGAGGPNDQKRLVAGMLDPGNLLDLIRTFTLFTVNEEGETIKMVGRYQQFRAVKLAVKRLVEGQSPRQRSGIVWHTQGSGKSLTMMFMVREMYRHAALANWKVVFVTDRTQLEQQLSETSLNIGFTVKVADSIQSLKELLRADTSDLVMAMIHKFREVDLEETFPELNASPRILVMTDEAHRSQYKLLGANLDRAIPNATRIGYTGTPIDKTEKVFGDYIDKYTLRQSIEDGVTLQIVYEGRTHKAGVPDQAAMDTAFEDVFSEYDLQERLQILGYGSREAYLEAESTIKAKAQDMAEHYLTHVFPNGYKAQVVATSREAAVRYKTHMDAALGAAVTKLEQSNPRRPDLERLKAMRTDVIISGKHNDLPRLKAYSDPSKHKTSIKSFKLPFGSEDEGVSGEVGILIVNNMLLTGFDAPLEQVMYLDRVVVAHNLLQAIARVNRIAGEDKNKGFVVDYVGIGHHLKEAIDVYDKREQTEVIDTLSSPENELRELQDSHAAIMELLKKNGLDDLSDHDAFFDVFYDEDLRFEFILAFKKLTRHLNLLFPAKQALDYMQGLQGPGRDQRVGRQALPRPAPQHEGNSGEVAGHHRPASGIARHRRQSAPISILDEDFVKDLVERTRTKTKAAEIEHAIRHHLQVELDDDPDLKASFAEALAAIFEQFRDNWQKIYEELEKLRRHISNVSREPTYGLHRKKQMPFFRMFRRELFGEDLAGEGGGRSKVVDPSPPYGWSEDKKISFMVDLTQKVFLAIERELRLTGFWQSIPAQNRLRAEIQRTLLAPDFVSVRFITENRRHLTSRAMEIAKRNNDVILFAK